MIARSPGSPLRRVVATLGLLIALGADAVAAPDNAVVLNFVNADIESVIRAVSEISGRNFVVDPRVKGVVNIISARPVPRSLVYPTLLSALRLQGYTAIEADGVTKIVPEADGRQHGSSVTVGPTVAARGDRLVTQVYTLRNESAAQLVPVLRPLITPNNTIAAFPAANALVITDYAENLGRIDRIVASLDQGTTTEPLIVPLRHASALDVAQTVGRLLIDAPAGGAPSGLGAEPMQRNAIIAEPRSNSVIVRADNPGRLARIRAFVEQLDTPARAGSNIRIVYLRNADAVRVAQTLRAVLTGTEGTNGPAPGLPPASALTPVSATALATGQPAYPMISPPPASGAGAAPPIAPISTGSATIHADPTNNALVISAPEPVYNNLREVIDKLDVRRAQVYVEALVAELTAERAAEFGVQWQFLDPDSLSPSYDGTGRPGGGTNFGQRGTGANIIDAMTNLGSVDRGLNIGLFRGQISIPGIGTIANLGVLVRALEGDANANILSMPNLLTLDNEPAQVVIGQNIPIVTGSYTLTGTNSNNPFQTFERRDVGLTLRVRPQITEGGSVKMQIFQEVSSVAESQPLSVSAGGVITNKRALESTVLVDDGQIIVLGGLLQDALTDGTEAVPGLGTLPVVGPLFRYDSRRRTKTNLMVFLRPRVIRTPAGSQAITADRYDYVVGEQRRSVPEQRFFWQDRSVPMLPVDGQWPPMPAGSPRPAQPGSGPTGTPVPAGPPDPVLTAPVPPPTYPTAPPARLP